MNILIISDIHSNLEALKEVFNYIRINEIEINRIIVLGDIIGYGPFPNETINFIKSLKNSEVIAGNHEWGVSNRLNLNYFNENAKIAIEWTKNMLTSENFNYIFNLPIELNFEFNNIKYLAVHGSPLNKVEEYIVNNYIAKQSFKALKEDVGFFGHTHIPYFYKYEGENVLGFYIEDEFEIKIEYSSFKYLINPGSVGQPRDGDNRVSFGILNTDSNIFKLKRLEYNFKVTQKYIIDYGLPTFLATRLAWGR